MQIGGAKMTSAHSKSNLYFYLEKHRQRSGPPEHSTVNIYPISGSRLLSRGQEICG